MYDHKLEIAPRIGVKPCLTFEELQGAIETKSRFVVFQPPIEFEADTVGGFEFFSDFAFAIAKCEQGVKLFFSDELQMFTDGDSIPYYLAAIVENGRIYEFDFLGASQMPQQIGPRLRNQMTEIVSFRLNEPRCFIWLSDLGWQENEIDTVRRLPRFQYISRDQMTGKTFSGKL